MPQVSQLWIRSISLWTYRCNAISRTATTFQSCLFLDRYASFTKEVGPQCQHIRKCSSSQTTLEEPSGEGKRDDNQEQASDAKTMIGNEGETIQNQSSIVTSSLSIESPTKAESKQKNDKEPVTNSSYSSTTTKAFSDTRIKAVLGETKRLKNEIKRIASIVPMLDARNIEWSSFREYDDHLREEVKKGFKNIYPSRASEEERRSDYDPGLKSAVERKQARALARKELTTQRAINLANVDKQSNYAYNIEREFLEVLNLLAEAHILAPISHEKEDKHMLTKKPDKNLPIAGETADESDFKSERTTVNKVQDIGSGHEETKVDEKLVRPTLEKRLLDESYKKRKGVPVLSIAGGTSLPSFPLSKAQFNDLLEKLMTSFIPQLQSYVVPPNTTQLEVRKNAILHIMLDPRHEQHVSMRILRNVIRFLVKKNMLNAARVVFLHIWELGTVPSQEIFSLLLSASARQRDLHNFLYFLHIMLHEQYVPSGHEWELFLDSCQTMEQKTTVLQKMDSLNLQPRSLVPNQFFPVAWKFWIEANRRETEIPELFRIDFDTLPMSKYTMTTVIAGLLRMGKDKEAFDFLERTFEKQHVLPSVVTLMTFVTFKSQRKRLPSIVEIVRHFQDKYHIHPSNDVLDKLFSAAFSSCAYNVGRVVWRHAAMNGMLTQRMLGFIKRHLRGCGPLGGAFGKFCVGVDLSGTPYLYEDTLWSQELDEVKWPPFILKLSEDELSMTKKAFKIGVDQIRSSIMKDDQLSCMKWYPAQELIDDLERAMKMDLKWGWGHRKDGYIYTKHFRSDLRDIEGNRILSNSGYVVEKLARVEAKEPAFVAMEEYPVADLKSVEIAEIDTQLKQVVKLD